MSMETHIAGFGSKAVKWNKMKAVWMACLDADIPIPADVEAFFDGTDPEESDGPEVDLEDCYAEWESKTSDSRGFEITVDNIPEGVEVIRVWNSW